MTKISKLNSIVNIIAGITFSPAMADSFGTYSVINATAISFNSIITEFNSKQTLKELPVKSQAITKENDLLIVSRAMPGGSFKASLIKTSIPLVATSSVYILRLTDQDLLPEYLNYYLNSRAFQKQLALKAKGATVMHISKVELGDLEVVVPSLSEQRAIVNLYENLLMQKRILLEQINIKDEIFEGTFLNLYKKYEHSNHPTRT